MVSALDTAHHRGLGGESDPQTADVAKLAFIHELVQQGRAENGALQSHAATLTEPAKS